MGLWLSIGKSRRMGMISGDQYFYDDGVGFGTPRRQRPFGDQYFYKLVVRNRRLTAFQKLHLPAKDSLALRAFTVPILTFFLPCQMLKMLTYLEMR